MRKVNVWKNLFLIVIGFLLGVVFTIKFLVPDTADIYIGKLKVKGENNSVNVENVKRK